MVNRAFQHVIRAVQVICLDPMDQSEQIIQSMSVYERRLLSEEL